MAEMAGASRDDLAHSLGHTFERPQLLRAALTHNSARRDGGVASEYQRLEFLGDRVLGLVVAELLYLTFPGDDEGNLAARHATLVRREALAKVARAIDLGRHIVVAPGEAEANLRKNPGVLADTCEAVIAAIYLDGGLDAARRFVEARWQPLMDAAPAPQRDPKTALQEWAQARGLPLPVYAEVARSGPDHAPVFVMTATVEGIAPAEAEGTSKRLAEQRAAERLLETVSGNAEAGAARQAGGGTG